MLPARCGRPHRPIAALGYADWAALNGHPGVARFLCERYAELDVFHKNSLGKTPLDHVFARGDEDMSIILLRHRSAAHLDRVKDGPAEGAEAEAEAKHSADAACGAGVGGEEIEEAKGGGAPPAGRARFPLAESGERDAAASPPATADADTKDGDHS